ncbi:hypothetical protein AB1Y20_008693 [Prymnesium parvum]|uniref:Nuclease HARBI1 n=1 Tax=Prymnesium parvum TaxID=97485 RepID=A0AB34IU11_PRYPA
MLPSYLSACPDEEWLAGYQQTPQQILELVIQRRRQQILLAAWLWLKENNRTGRNRSCQTFDWEEHVRGLKEIEFKARYRLTPVAFYNLLDLIEKDIELDAKEEKQGRNGRSGAEPLQPAVRLAIALRMFAGASYLDLMLIYKVRSTQTIYKSMWDCVAAINQALEVAFPLGDQTKLNTLEAEFRSNSPGQYVWEGCVGCIDGVHFKMLKPSLQEVSNPTNELWGKPQSPEEEERGKP